MLVAIIEQYRPPQRFLSLSESQEKDSAATAQLGRLAWSPCARSLQTGFFTAHHTSLRTLPFPQKGCLWAVFLVCANFSLGYPTSLILLLLSAL